MEPFALLWRAENPDRVDRLTGTVTAVERLADLRTAGPRHDVLAMIPYRQITERGFACRDDGEPIRALTVTDQTSTSVAEAVNALPDTVTHLRDQRFDVEDQRYAAIVSDVLRTEIGGGEGSNFVIQRSFTATIDGYVPAVAMAVFRRLLTGESGAYWTFLIHTGDRTFVGASPERHVRLRDRTVVMNPISGTYRYPAAGPSVAEILRFLADRKETDELSMVVDEELKMMAAMCGQGIRVHGPNLREMARLAHTEYVLSGQSSSQVEDILRTTMFAPTVTGSPIENACRVISKYEPTGRGYYGGVAALIGTDDAGRPTLDSTILIRTADIDDAGRLRIAVGATLVRHSDPGSEVAETRVKAAALLDAFRGRTGPVPRPRPDGVGTHPSVRRALSHRNTTLARFWLDHPGAGPTGAPELIGRRILIVDAEDAFSSMIGHQLRSLRLDVTVRRFDEVVGFDDFDLVVMGPGPGDPRDDRLPGTATMHRLTGQLLAERRPFLAVCLGHQVLCRVLGLELVRRDEPNQGVQREIDLFGRRTRVGFYNTFVARSDVDRFASGIAGGVVEVSHDRDTGEVHALRGPCFASVQFHAESVLTTDGTAILAELLARQLGGRVSSSGRARRTAMRRPRRPGPSR